MTDTCKICGASVPPSKQTGRVSKWGVIKAGADGWFFQKDGTTYCPKHVPAWVESWRARRDDR